MLDYDVLSVRKTSCIWVAVTSALWFSYYRMSYSYPSQASRHILFITASLLIFQLGLILA